MVGRDTADRRRCERDAVDAGSPAAGRVADPARLLGRPHVLGVARISGYARIIPPALYARPTPTHEGLRPGLVEIPEGGRREGAAGHANGHCSWEQGRRGGSEPGEEVVFVIPPDSPEVDVPTVHAEVVVVRQAQARGRDLHVALASPRGRVSWRRALDVEHAHQAVVLPGYREHPTVVGGDSG